MLLKILLIWVALITIFAFFRMGWDKRAANKEKSRVPEKQFYIIALLGGTLGIFLGMRVWRHKTQKWKFKLPVYAIFALQIILLLVFLYFYFVEGGGA